MVRPAPPSLKVQELLARVPVAMATPEEHERQIVSFAYGNARIENERVTRPLVERAAHASSGLEAK